MKKTYYYIFSMLILLLFYSPKAKAYSTGYVNANATDGDNNTITVRMLRYWDLQSDSFTQADSDYTYYWDIPWNIQLENMQLNRYYTGILRFQVNVSCSDGSVQLDQPILLNSQIAEGLHVYIYGNTSTWFQVCVIFDNYYTQGTDVLGLPTITQKAVRHYDSETIPLDYAPNFTPSLTITSSGTLRSQTTIWDKGFAGLIADSIDNSTALATMAGWLYDIKTQDLSYYSQLVTQIAALTQAQNTANADLLLILNELDLDFQQVQTILDLFPSYRTQVLQYWQQLLEMNAAQSQAAAEAASVAADKDNQSQQLINGMGSVVMPSLASGDLDILGGVDTTQKTNFFGLIGLITHTEIITKIMLIIVIGAIVGYVLYGKK